MSQSHKIIQVLAKIFLILAKIGYVFCIIGLVGCILGIVSLSVGFTDIQIGDVTIKSLIENNSGMSMGTLYAEIITGLFFCMAGILQLRYSKSYFKNELKAGTPFTKEGALELRRLGLYTILSTIAACLLSAIVVGILKLTMENVVFELNSYGSTIGTGILILLFSVIFEYGSEVAIKEPTEEKVEETTQE